MKLLRRAFTLIELLVVIAIIAILAAILFPVFAQAKEAAKSTVCLSNTKNVALAILMYGGDADDQIVPWQNAHRRTNPDPLLTQIHQSWPFLIQPYTKNYGIFFDPSWSESNLEKAADGADCDGTGAPGSSAFLPAADLSTILPPSELANTRSGYLSHYALPFPGLYNSTGCDTTGSAAYAHYPGAGWSDTTETTFVNVGLTNITEPARTAFIGDGTTHTYKFGSGWRTTTGFGCEGQFRHKGKGANYGFTDGHSVYIPLNPERVLAKDSSGCFYEKYFSYDK